MRCADGLVPCAIPSTALPGDWAGWIGGWLLAAGAVVTAAAIPTSIVLMKVGLGLAFAGAIAARVPVHRYPGFAWALLASALMLASWAANRGDGYPGKAIDGFQYIWPLGFVLVPALVRAEVRRWCAWALGAGVAVAVAVAVAQFTIGYDGDRGALRIAWDGSGERGYATGLFAHHIRFGFAMALAALLAGLPTAGAGLGWLRLLWTALAAVGLALSMARGQVLALIAGAGTLLVLRLRRWWLGALGAGAVAILAVGALWLVTPERVQSMLDGRDGRRAIWSVATQAIAERPWRGHGDKAMDPAIARRIASGSATVAQFNELRPGHAHNLWIHSAFAYGIPAAVALSAWLAWLGLALIRLRRADPQPAVRAATAVGLGVLGAAAVGSLTEPLLLQTAPLHAVMLAWAWCVGTAVAARQEPADG